MLNFGDFSRYCKSYASVKRGNFWGLLVNFLAFSLVTVVTTSATLPVFGEMMTDPVATVGRIAAIAVACVMTPALAPLANFSWFIGVALGARARAERNMFAVPPVIGLPIWARNGVFYTLIRPN